MQEELYLEIYLEMVNLKLLYWFNFCCIWNKLVYNSCMFQSKYLQTGRSMLPVNIRSNMSKYFLSSSSPVYITWIISEKSPKNRDLLEIYSKILIILVNLFLRRYPTILALQFPLFSCQYPFSNKSVLGWIDTRAHLGRKVIYITYHFVEYSKIQIRQMLLYPDENISIPLTYTCHLAILQRNREEFTPLVMHPI